MLIKSKIVKSKDAKDVQPFANFNASAYTHLPKFGIHFSQSQLKRISSYSYAMDDNNNGILSPNIPVPIQKLQNWLPGFVLVATAARKIDEILGYNTIGDWADEEIVQQVVEQRGKPVPYGDYTNVPQASWTASYETRTIVRFEEGLRVGKLEEARAQKINISSAGEKREAAMEALEIVRNDIGFNGYQDGNGGTYGFLNDPSLPAYVDFPDGASTSPAWSTKTFEEIQADLRTMLSALRQKSKDRIDPTQTPLTLVLPTAVVDYLSVTTAQGVSVMNWLNTTYPKVRIVSAPQMEGIVGGLNAAYLFADKINDRSTDDGKTFAQNIASKFFMLGVSQDVKFYVEAFANALAGILLKRPYAVVRYAGC